MKFPYLAWNKERDSLDNIVEIGQEQKEFISPSSILYTLQKTSNITVPIKMLSMATESKYYFLSTNGAFLKS